MHDQNETEAPGETPRHYYDHGDQFIGSPPVMQAPGAEKPGAGSVLQDNAPAFEAHPEVAVSFLGTVFGEKLPDAARIVLWHKDKRPAFLRSPEEARTGLECLGVENVYVGLALQPDIPKGRGTAKTVLAIPGFALDLDFLSPAHKKKGLPSKERAEKFLGELPLRPSIVVMTGHGYQPWFLLKEPWILREPGERERAAELSRAFSDAVMALAQERGFEVDAVHDLAHVFRLPGTINAKPDVPPVEVQLLETDGPRYEVSDFERVGPLGKTRRTAPSNGNIEPGLDGDLIFTEDRAPPLDKLDLLRENVKKFDTTWLRKRKDFKDSSGSAYCFSLANQAHRAGWSTQEIVDLLIAWRRKHGENLKLDRPDWYTKHTIVPATQSVEDIPPEPLPPEAEGDDTRGPEEHLKVLRHKLGLSALVKIVKRGTGQDDLFELHFTNGAVVTLEDITQPNRVQRALAHGAGVAIRGFKREDWNPAISQRLIDAAEVVATTSEAEETRHWVERYHRGLATSEVQEPLTMENKVVMLSGGGGFGVDRFWTTGLGVSYLRLEVFTRWVQLTRQGNLSNRQMAARLSRLGFTRVSLTARSPDGGKTRSANFWRSPPGFERGGEEEGSGSGA